MSELKSSLDYQEECHKLEHDKIAAMQDRCAIENAINEKKRELLILKDGLEKARVNCAKLDATYRIAKDCYFTAMREGR
jgi:hypothetical protein